MLLIGENALRRRIKPRETTLAQALRTLLIFLIVSSAWIFFRADSVQDAFYVFSHLFTGITRPLSYLRAGFSDRGVYMNWLQLLEFCVVWMLPLLLFDAFSLKNDVIVSIGRQNPILRWGCYCCLIAVILMCRAIGNVSFVYFQF